MEEGSIAMAEKTLADKGVDFKDDKIFININFPEKQERYEVEKAGLLNAWYKVTRVRITTFSELQEQLKVQDGLHDTAKA